MKSLPRYFFPLQLTAHRANLPLPAPRPRCGLPSLAEAPKKDFPLADSPRGSRAAPSALFPRTARQVLERGHGASLAYTTGTEHTPPPSAGKPRWGPGKDSGWMPTPQPSLPPLQDTAEPHTAPALPLVSGPARRQYWAG